MKYSRLTLIVGYYGLMTLRGLSQEPALDQRQARELILQVGGADDYDDDLHAKWAKLERNADHLFPVMSELIGSCNDELSLQNILVLAQTCAATKRAEINNLALQLLNRPDLDRIPYGAVGALRVLEKCGDASHIATVQKYESHSDRWIRLAAKHALEELTGRLKQSPEGIAASSQQSGTAWKLVVGLTLAAVGLVWWLFKAQKGARKKITE